MKRVEERKHQGKGVTAALSELTVHRFLCGFECIFNHFWRTFKQNKKVKGKAQVILTRPLLFLFLDRTMARMPTTIPCRDKTDEL